MKKSKRIQPLVKLAEQDEQRKAMTLREQQHKLQQEQDRLAAMHNYKREYRQGIDNEAQQGINAQRMFHLIRFTEQLDRLVLKQHQVISECERVLAQRMAAWQQANGRYQALKNASHRLRQAELALAAKQEQNEIDELVTQRYHHRGT